MLKSRGQSTFRNRHCWCMMAEGLGEALSTETVSCMGSSSMPCRFPSILCVFSGLEKGRAVWLLLQQDACS